MQTSIFIGKEIEAETRNWLKSENVDFEESAFFKIVFHTPDVRFFKSLKNRKKFFVTTSNWAAKWILLNHKQLFINSTDSIFCLSYKQVSSCLALSPNCFIARENNASSLANLILEKEKDEIIIYLKGDKSLNILENRLAHLGLRFQEMEVYENLPLTKKVVSDFGVYVFFSPSGVQNFHQSGNQIKRTSKIVAIGTTTAQKCLEVFKRQVCISPLHEELATIKYAVNILKTSPCFLQTN